MHFLTTIYWKWAFDVFSSDFNGVGFLLVVLWLTTTFWKNDYDWPFCALFFTIKKNI